MMPTNAAETPTVAIKANGVETCCSASMLACNDNDTGGGNRGPGSCDDGAESGMGGGEGDSRDGSGVSGVDGGGIEQSRFSARHLSA